MHDDHHEESIDNALDHDFDLDGGYVVVVGSSGIDVKGRPQDDTVMAGPVNGHIRNSVGGVARNIAENLVLLEVPVILLSAVGDDAEGDRVLAYSTEHGINCDYVRVVPDGRTGVYMALQHPNGDARIAISDFDITQYIDSDYLQQHEILFSRARMVVIDATLSDDAMDTLFEIASHYNLRVCADPTTPALAGRLRPYLPQLYLVVPNAGETNVLCDVPTAVDGDRQQLARTMARELVRLGAGIAVVTLGNEGLAYADSSGVGYIRATEVDVIDTTGAGDAFTAAVIFGLLNGVDVDEAMRLGATAAALTVSTYETIVPGLTQERLYDELVV